MKYDYKKSRIPVVLVTEFRNVRICSLPLHPHSSDIRMQWDLHSLYAKCFLIIITMRFTSLDFISKSGCHGSPSCLINI